MILRSASYRFYWFKNALRIGRLLKKIDSFFKSKIVMYDVLKLCNFTAFYIYFYYIYVKDLNFITCFKI